MRVTWSRALGLIAGAMLCSGMVGCSDKEEPDPIDTGPFDRDGDGYVFNEDCNDDNDQIFPDALEFCDGRDNNCDGDIDEDSAVDATTWCVDADRDGYGVDSGCKRSCEPPDEGYADNTDDCSDVNAYINPEGIEICDIANHDEDCNGVADDDDPGVDPDTQYTFYPDADGDGYGDMNAEGQALCDDPTTSSERYATNDEDCNDDSRRFNPDEDEDTTDGLDNNCNGCTDEVEGADEEPSNGVDDDCDTCVDETEDDGLLNWYYSEDYDVWWSADWCHKLDEGCPDCDWAFTVQLEYEDELSTGASEIGYNTDLEWTLGWGEAYPDIVWYYAPYYGNWYDIFEADFEPETGRLYFEYGYWESESYPQL